LPNNNPSGVNSWEGFGTEEPYGQATQDAALAGAAPLAGGKVASGRPSAPPQPTQTATAPQGQPEPPVQLSAADVWHQIASTPGAENYPLLNYYASKA